MAGWVILLVSVLGGLVLGLLRRPPLLLVLALNLVPVAGVLWAGWSPLQLLLLYWIENVAVGVFNWLKLRDYEARKPQPGPQPFKVSTFFVMHYGTFTLVHGVFAVGIGALYPGPGAVEGAWSGQHLYGFVAATLTLAAVQLFDWLGWRGRKGWEGGSVEAQMFAPYGRVVTMHLTIIGGAFVLAVAHAPVAWVALLAVLKTFFETGFAAMSQKEMAAQAPGLSFTWNGKVYSVGKKPRAE